MDIKTFLPVILLLVVSCSGEQPAGRPTVDATQRWLNAKCPPSELCAPQNEPESIGRAYLVSALSGNCNEAASFWTPDSQSVAVENCQQGIVLSGEINRRCRLTKSEIDKAIIEDTVGGNSIIFSGHFLYVCDDVDNDHQSDSLKLFLSEHDREWEIAGIEG